MPRRARLARASDYERHYLTIPFVEKKVDNRPELQHLYKT
jgi:hypothetical protein